MKRIEFIKKTALLATFSLPVFTLISSCSEEAAPEPPLVDPTDCAANGTKTAITANHGHTLFVSASDVQSGVEKTYLIQGGATHPHSLTISATMFTELIKNKSLDVASSNDSGHSHSITVSCA